MHYRFGATGISRFLWLSAAFRDVYSTATLLFWYLAMYMQFILLHEKFEYRLSIQVSKTIATCHFDVHLETEKSL
jgi:hypothetical protein